MTTSGSTRQASQSGQAPPGKRMTLPPPPLAFVRRWCDSRGRNRVIVALDMGTSTSRMSVLVLPRDYDESEQKVHHSGVDEIPTAVFQKTLPNGDEEWAFGRDALERFEDETDDDDDEDEDGGEGDGDGKTVVLYRNFKTMLHAPNFMDSQDVEEMEVACTTGRCTHNLMGLMGRYIHFLSQLALAEVRSATQDGDEDDDSFRADVPHDDDEIQWVLTVPCIWDDLAKSFVRRAACRAGLIREETSERLLLAIDSEAASLVAFGEGARLGLFGTGASFLVVDCGGGTVDMAAHTVGTADHDDFLVLDAMTAPRGGPWGANGVDEEFADFLRDLLGNHTWEGLLSSCPGEVERVLQDFANLKSSFDPDHCEDGLKVSLGFLLRRRPTTAEDDLPDLTALVRDFNSRTMLRPLFDLESKALERNLRKSALVFTKEQVMAFFFKPTLDRIADAFEDFLTETEATTIVLVGDYGSSKVVGSRLRSIRDSISDAAHVITPERPQAAVLRGASYFALAPDVLGSRIVAWTYGISSQREWTPGCGFDRQDAELDSTTGKLMVDGVFSTLVRSGTSVPYHRVFKSCAYAGSETPMTVQLYKSTESCPRRVTDVGCERVGTIHVPCTNASTVRLLFSFGTEVSVRLVRNDEDGGILIPICITSEAPEHVGRPFPPRRTTPLEEIVVSPPPPPPPPQEEQEIVVFREEEIAAEEEAKRAEDDVFHRRERGPLPTTPFVPPPAVNPSYRGLDNTKFATEDKKDEEKKFLKEDDDDDDDDDMREEAPRKKETTTKKAARQRGRHCHFYNSQEPPNEFFCKLTLAFMDDPVIATDGETYERAALEKWFAEFPRGEKPRSPATGLRLESRSLIPNRAIKKQIQDYVALYGHPQS